TPTGLLNRINQEAVANTGGLSAYLNVYYLAFSAGSGATATTVPSGGVAVGMSDQPDETGACNPVGKASAAISYAITIKPVAAGAGSTTFTSSSGAVTGTIAVSRTVPSLVKLTSAPSFALTDGRGTYRLNVGVTSVPATVTSPFVLLSVLSVDGQTGATRWK